MNVEDFQIFVAFSECLNFSNLIIVRQLQRQRQHLALKTLEHDAQQSSNFPLPYLHVPSSNMHPCQYNTIKEVVAAMIFIIATMQGTKGYRVQAQQVAQLRMLIYLTYYACQNHQLLTMNTELAIILNHSVPAINSNFVNPK